MVTAMNRWVRIGILAAVLAVTGGAMWLFQATYSAEVQADATEEPARLDYSALAQETPAAESGRRVIDTHAHLFNPASWPNIEAVMNTHGIERFINLSGGAPRRGMTRALELQAESQGRILNCMTINWDGIDEVAFGETVAAELELAVTRYHYVGLKVSKALGLGVVDADGYLIPVDDARLFPIWQKAGELGVPVFIHTSDPAAFWEPTTPENERYDELNAHPNWSFSGPEYPPRDELLRQRDHLLELFPQTTFIGLHFGNNPEDIEYVARVLATYPNLYVDLAARVPEIGRHDPAAVRDLFMTHQDRILFATDIAMGITRRGDDVLVLGSSGEEPDTPERIGPFFEAHWRFLETNDTDFAHPTPIQGNWTISGIGLPEEVLQKIYYGNAHRLIIEPALRRAGIEE